MWWTSQDHRLCTEDPLVVAEKILTHLKEKTDTRTPTPLPGSRARPPVSMLVGLFD
jgi:hypothetical protein